MDQQNIVVAPNTVETKYVDSVYEFIEGRDLNFEKLKTILNQATSDELIAVAKKIIEDFLSSKIHRPIIYNDPSNSSRLAQSSESKQSINDAISIRKKDIRYLIAFHFLINNKNLEDSTHSILATLLKKKTEIKTEIFKKFSNDYEKEEKKNKNEDIGIIRELTSYFSPKNTMTQEEKDKFNRDPIKKFFDELYHYFDESMVVAAIKKEQTRNNYFFLEESVDLTPLVERLKDAKSKSEFYKDYITIIGKKNQTFENHMRADIGVFYHLYEYHLKIKDVATPYPIIGMLIMFQSILISKGILTKEEAPFPEPEESVALPFAKPTIGLKIAKSVRSLKNRLGFETNIQLGGKRKSKTKKQIKKTIKKSRKRR